MEWTGLGGMGWDRVEYQMECCGEEGDRVDWMGWDGIVWGGVELGAMSGAMSWGGIDELVGSVMGPHFGGDLLFFVALCA